MTVFMYETQTYLGRTGMPSGLMSLQKFNMSVTHADHTRTGELRVMYAPA